MPGFLWNEFPCGRSKHRGTTNKDLLFNYSSHYSVWIASGSVSTFDFTERSLAKTLGLQPAGMVKLRFANTAKAALCEHRKRSEVQHCRKKTLGHQWSPKSTWGINCKQNSALRCLLMSSFWANLTISHIHKPYELLLCFFLGDGGNQMFKCFWRVVFFGATA